MDTANEFKEFTGRTLEDAITEACASYTVPSPRLEYEVVSEGSKGFMGIGAKPAVIKARVRIEPPKTEPASADKVWDPEQKKFVPAPPKQPKPKPQPRQEAKPEQKPESKSQPKSEPRSQSQPQPKPESMSLSEQHPKPEARTESQPKSVAKQAPQPAKPKEPRPEPVDKTKRAVEFLSSVFAAMHLEVEISTSWDGLEDTLNIEFAGERMGVLIGKRGMTLDALQYLTSLVVNRGAGGFVRVDLDTEGYRARREEALKKLAANVSAKVTDTHSSVALEPMNPFERRVIHTALQDDPYVTTSSVGEEPYRRVVVAPKGGGRDRRRDNRNVRNNRGGRNGRSGRDSRDSRNPGSNRRPHKPYYEVPVEQASNSADNG